LLREYLAAGPRCVPFLEKLGALYQEKGDVLEAVAEYGKAIDIEGAKEGKWVVIDYGDVIVHVFLEDMRAYYDLDDLWSNAEKVAIPEEYQWEHREP